MKARIQTRQAVLPGLRISKREWCCSPLSWALDVANLGSDFLSLLPHLSSRIQWATLQRRARCRKYVLGDPG